MKWPFLLQPCDVPGSTEVQARFETQGRGFIHGGHGKGHSIITPSMKWLRSVRRDLAEAVRSLRQSLLSTAATVQYEAANEPARQMGVGTIAPEPFTERQQRQSRMDGAEDRDGTVREYVPVAPPVMQPHILEQKPSCCRKSDATAWFCSLQRSFTHGGVPVIVPMVQAKIQFCMS